ncbi:MAG TPA: hypothetical protein VE422_30835 [Terriglobia bacterium]|nr:hypothetical protein [Terriglobia bacterium]
MMHTLIAILTQLFGAYALLMLIAAGFLMMVNPKTAKTLLKNIAIATALFIVGSMLLSSF